MRRYVLSDFQFMPRLRVANTNTVARTGCSVLTVLTTLILFGVLNVDYGAISVILCLAFMTPIFQGRSPSFVIVGSCREFMRHLLRRLGQPRLDRFAAIDEEAISNFKEKVSKVSFRAESEGDHLRLFHCERLIVIRLEAKRPPQLNFDDEEERFLVTARWLDSLVDLVDVDIAKLRIVHSRDESILRSAIRSYLVASVKSNDIAVRRRCEDELIKIMSANSEFARFVLLDSTEIAAFCFDQFYFGKASTDIRYMNNSLVVRGGSYQLWGITDFGRFSGGFGEIFSVFAKISSVRALIIEIVPISQQRYSSSIRAQRSRIDAKVLWRNSKGFSRSLLLAKATKALAEAEVDISNNVKGANFSFYLIANRANSVNVPLSARSDCSIRIHGFTGVVRETWEHINPVVV